MPDPATDQMPPARAGLLERQRTRRWSVTRAERSPTPGSAATRRVPRFHVVTVATGWRSAFGGLNTLNRELCCALAAAGSRVVCVVPHAEAAELQDARARQVHLMAVPGLLSSQPKPEWPRGFVPELVIGHGRVTGPAARDLTAALPGARRLHVVHVAPDEIDPLKTGRPGDQGTRSEARTKKEVALGRTAYRIVAVGPRLHDRYTTDFGRRIGTPVLQLDPGFDTAAQPLPGPPGGKPWRVFLFARTEDDHLKGIDIGVRAVARAAEWRGKRVPDLEFWVRGAPPGTTDTLAAKLRAWAGNDLARIVVRTYTTDPADLQDDLGQASLVLMPSRSEGFGLTGLEAITAEVPVLVSGASGLGLLLSTPALLPEEAAYRTVVPVEGDFSEVTDRWARSVEAVLRDREAAFGQARDLHVYLAARKTWSMAATALLDSI